MNEMLQNQRIPAYHHDPEDEFVILVVACLTVLSILDPSISRHTIMILTPRNAEATRRDTFAINSKTSTKESVGRSRTRTRALSLTLFLRLGRRKRRSAASAEETSRCWALALSLLFGRGRVGRLGGHCDL
jgi:hypothetical protein